MNKSHQLWRLGKTPLIPALCGLAALIASPAQAGHWEVVFNGTQTGYGGTGGLRTFANNVVTSPNPAAPPGSGSTNNFQGAGYLQFANVSSGSNKGEIIQEAPTGTNNTYGLQVSPQLVWKPDFVGDTSTPPSKVGVLETSDSHLFVLGQNTTSETSHSDDGLGDPSTDTLVPAVSPPGLTQAYYKTQSSGTFLQGITVPPGQTTITLQTRNLSDQLTLNGGQGPTDSAMTYQVSFASAQLRLWDCAYSWSTNLDFTDGNIAKLTCQTIANKEAVHPFRKVVGAATDGASKILLEFDSITPDTPTFSTNAPNPNLYIIPGGPVSIGNGVYASYAVYSVPDVAVAFTTYGQMTLPVTFTATSIAPTCNQPFTLGRPPVVLAHGLWDKGQTWISPTGPFNELTSKGFTVSVLDYQQTNHSSFATNLHTVWLGQGGIWNAIEIYHGKQWASSNADVVGHSMGGIITRYFASEPLYAKVDNYYKGYVHRLVTIGSPHYGSPQSELYYWLYKSTRRSPPAVDEVAWIFILAYPIVGPTSTPPLPGLALRDLSPGSVALASIHNPKGCRLPVYAEVGNASPYGNVPALGEEVGVMAQDLFMAPNPGHVFVNGNATDTTVSDVSQQGGLAAPFFVTVTNNIIHLPLPVLPLTSEQHSTAIGQDILVQLYNDNFNFAGFPATMPDPNDGLNLPSVTDPYATLTYDPNGLPLIPPALGAATIAIAEPASGQVFAPGSSVNVTFTPNSGTTIASTTVTATDSSGQLVASTTATSAPFNATITIPQTTVGNVTILATASDTASRASIATTSISAKTTATLQSLTVNQQVLPTFVGAGQTQQLQVMAAYSDGISRDVTTAGTTYTSANTSVATVSATGLVTAVGNGATQIVITNGSVVTTAAVGVSIQAPQVLAVSPLGAGAGQAVSLRLDGINFGGASSIQFLTPTGQVDPNVTVSGIALSPNGYTLTANVTLSRTIPQQQDTVVVTATGGSSSALPVDHSTFTILPRSNVLSLLPNKVQGVQTIQGTLSLSAPVPDGSTLTLTSSDPSVTVPATVTVYGGEITESFTLTTSQVTAQKVVTITANYNGTNITATLTELP